MAKFVRLDVLSGNRDTSKVKSAKYYKNNEPAEAENGTIVALGDLLDGERELHKAVDAGASDTFVGIVTTPEIDASREYNSVSAYVNKADEPIRVHILEQGDIFSIGGSEETEDIALGAKLLAKHTATESRGSIVYQVYEVRSV